VHNFAHENDILIHFHLSETEKEVTDCIAQHQLRPVHYLDKIGFLSPRLVAAHGVWLDDSELELLAARGVKLIHNPSANCKLSVGKAFRYPEVRKNNIKMCLGTDGCASNNNLDMLEEIKFAALLQKLSTNNPTLRHCTEAWDLITKDAHKILNVDAGEIAEGKLADFILVDMTHPQMVPCHDLISNMVYAGNSAVVDTVVCNGQIVMENRIVPGEKEIIRKAQEVTDNLLAR